jgi:hypothetical protein
MDQLILDESVQMEVAETRKHIKVLQSAHRKLTEKAKIEKLSDSERDLLKQVIEAHNNLQRKLRELSPTLVDLALKIANEGLD